MQTMIKYGNNEEKINLPTDSESDFYKNLAKKIMRIPIPNIVEVECDLGKIRYQLVKKGGTMFVREDYNSIRGLPPANYPKEYLTCINADFNNYKFYQLEQLPNGKILATYGRITNPDENDRTYMSRCIPTSAHPNTYEYESSMFWIKYIEKLAKGYKNKTAIYFSDSEKKTRKTETKKKVKKADKMENSVPYQRLITDLRKYANQTITSVSKGKMKITEGMVNESKKQIKKLYQMKTVRGFNNHLLELLAVLPRNVEDVKKLLAKKESDFAEIIAREEDLLLAMELLVNTDDEVEEVNYRFKQKVEVYEATEKQKEIVMRCLNDSLKSKVKRIYRVIPSVQQKKFNDYLKNNKISEVKQLWHGSRNQNWGSIIENGLSLNPNAIITGKMFGNGIYFAPSSAKSFNYTSFRGTSWAHGTSDVAFMGLYAVATGKPLDVYCAHSYTQKELDRQGKNSVHAHAGTQLLNDEIILYDEAAMVLNYLVEFAA